MARIRVFKSIAFIVAALLALLGFALAEEHNLRNQPQNEDAAVENLEEFFEMQPGEDEPLNNGPDAQEVAQVNEDVEGPFGPPKPKRKACWKDGEPRGRGRWPDRETRQCPANQEKSMGMCYPHCGENRNGFGPLCLDDCSKTPYRANGMVFCCDTDDICKELVQNLAMKLPKSLIRFVIDIASNPNDARRIMRDFRELANNALQLRLPMCSKMKDLQEVELMEDAGAISEVMINDDAFVAQA